jgi:hypothetical protein
MIIGICAIAQINKNIKNNHRHTFLETASKRE